MDRIEKLGMGATSLLATIGVQELPLDSLLQALTQIIIAVGTLIAIFRKKNV